MNSSSSESSIIQRAKQLNWRLPKQKFLALLWALGAFSGCPAATATMAYPAHEADSAPSREQMRSETISEELSVPQPVPAVDAPSHSLPLSPQTPATPEIAVDIADVNHEVESDIKRARVFYDSATRQRRQGRPVEAFRNARNAWNLVHDFKDPQGHALAAKIRDELDLLAREISITDQNVPSSFQTLLLE